ncbi:MAG: hypothetical protein E7452_04645, partial [Ruminococcaceae bacterium]|nr:hypothetical protein [Oscillospiraceae bacterium]
MKKRILSIVLIFCMVCSLLPVSALAVEAETETYPAVRYGTDGIIGWDAEAESYDYIYFGNWKNAGDTQAQPLKWRVLDDKANNGQTGLFLMSEQILGYKYTDINKGDGSMDPTEGGIYFEKTGFQTGEDVDVNWGALSEILGGNPSVADELLEAYTEFGYSTMYQGSDLQNWFTDFAGVTQNAYVGSNGSYVIGGVQSAFNATELAAILATAKNDDSYIANEGLGMDAFNVVSMAYNGILAGDKVFPMSAQEAESEAYGFGGGDADDEELARRLGEAEDGARAWLRSYTLPGDAKGMQCLMLGAVGLVDDHPNFAMDFSGDAGYTEQATKFANDLGVRPAFNLDPSKVLFVTAADNSGHQNTLAAVGSVDSKEWKLTLKDGSSFSAEIAATSAAPGGSLTVTHDAMGAGYTNITAAILDAEGTLVAYGSINNTAEATTSTIALPETLADGVYTISVQAEDWNGANYTDYASTPYTTTVKVSSAHSHDNQTWTAIGSEAELAALTAGGYGFLVADIEVDDETVYDGNLCLNGFELIGAMQANGLNIYDCTERGSTGAITVPKNGTLSLYDGVTVQGGDSSALVINGTLNLLGAPTLSSTQAQIDLGESGVISLTKPISVDAPYTIRVDADHTVTSGWASAMGSAEFDTLFTAAGGFIASADGKELAISVALHETDHAYCGAKCTHGENHQVTTWTLLTSWGDIVSHSKAGKSEYDEDIYILEAGSYALTGNIALQKPISVNGTVNLCLNGYELNLGRGGDYHYNYCDIRIPTGSTLNLCDCRESENTGMITNSATAAINIKGGTFNFYSGCFSDNKDSSDAHSVNVINGGTFNMFGGKISRGPYPYEEYAVKCGYNTTVNISGGKIYENGIYADNGAVLRLSNSPEINLITVRLSNDPPPTIDASGLADGVVIPVTLSSFPEDGSTKILFAGGAADAEHFTLPFNVFGWKLIPSGDNLAVESYVVVKPTAVTFYDKNGNAIANEGELHLFISETYPLSRIEVSPADATEAFQFDVSQSLGFDKETLVISALTSSGDGSYKFRASYDGNYYTLGIIWVHVHPITLQYAPGAGVDGEAATQDINTTENVTIEDALFERDGYRQVGWSYTDGGEKDFDLKDEDISIAVFLEAGVRDDTAHTCTVALYPVWEAEEYTVTLKTNGGTIAYGKNVTGYTHGTETALPTAGEMFKNLYTFEGWYENADFSGEAVTAISATDIGNKTYYAKWELDGYSVNFDLQGHGDAIDEQKIQDGGKVTEPAAPTASGYIFGGWYKEAACITAWDFGNDTVSEATTLYAKWTEKAIVSISEDVQTYTWDGTAKTFAISGTPGDGFAVQYKVNDNWTDTVPSAVGTYDVKVTRAEDETYKAYEKEITGGLVVNAAAPEATAPTAKTGLVYDGNAKSLINAGTSEHGYWEYSLDGT